MFNFFILSKQNHFLCVVMGVGKNDNQKIATMLYVVMFGDGKGLAHYNAHT